MIQRLLKSTGEFTCAMCLTQFDTGEHCPYVLMCGHNVCYKSIKRMGKRLRTRSRKMHIECPMCKFKPIYKMRFKRPMRK